MKSASVISVAMAAVITPPPPLLVSPNYGKFHPESELERASSVPFLPPPPPLMTIMMKRETAGGEERGGEGRAEDAEKIPAAATTLFLSLILI